MYTLHVFHAADGHRIEADLGQVPALLEDPEVTIWLDLEEPLAEHEARVLHEAFRFHPLAIEDTLHDYGHPKLDVYDDHFFVILHAIDFETLDLLNKVHFATSELDIFVGRRLMVSHHAPGMRSITALHQELDHQIRGRWGAARLFHRLLDRLVDNYIPVIEQVGETLERLEDDVIQEPAPALLDRILNAKKTIFRLRRILGHQKSILDSLARGHRELVPPDQLAFFRDVHDHFVYVVDQVESFREQVQSIMDAYLSVSSNRMNEIMKVLTQISTVMLPLTFIAGVYGMNFDHMPELHWSLGYPFAIILMLATAGGFVLYFRRRNLL
ncbi:MAG: magnesium/cobalt transporter CorA [Myxococcales bacterium]|nr:magnesium/cobalt transporter CorA [Myxococcales bacterium]MCB9568059.1 magnesium/cobalt transporter CorA [Myxococcales bacterium]MCB9705285.1 magnesium/cobalt transporter CorA [Myxococcales bacterium]